MEVGLPSQISPSGKLPGDVPAMATWYDNAQQLFLALMAPPADAVPSNDGSEQVEYRVLVIKSSDDRSASSSSSYPEPLSVVQEQRILKFRLPTTLAAKKHRVQEPGSVDKNQTHHLVRVPLDVKLSLDQSLLAIQFTRTLVRIVPLQRPEDESSSSNTSQNHWTIDLSTGSIEPVSTGPHSVRTAGNSSEGRPSSESDGNNSIDYKREFEILVNGIVFSDHGGNSQDLMLVTTKAVVCYKISLRRNQMAVAHTFPQSPPACAVWYDPPTRSVVIGSVGSAMDCSNVGKDSSRRGGSSSSASESNPKGSSITTVQLRTFLLRFPTVNKPKMGLPRLELPPPRRLPLYAAGRSRIFRIFSSNKSTTRQTELEPIIAPNELWLINMYGDAYIVEMESSSVGLQLVLHRVDSTLGVVYFKTYTIEDFHLAETKMEDVLLSVLDNVLFVSFRDETLFLDVLDADNTYYLEKTSDAIATLLESQEASFRPPGLLLDGSGRGQVIPLALGIEKLANILPWTPSLVPFFLRRQASPRSCEIAISKLEVLVTRDLPPDGSSLQFQETRRTMDMVVQMYTVDKAINFSRDWNVGLSLLYDSAFLPSDSVFRQHAVDAMITSSYIARIMKRPHPSIHNILYQSEILRKILIPAAKTALRDNEQSRIHQILDFAVSMLGALDRCQRPSSPALECLIFSILWYLGYEPELVRFLESRCRSKATWKKSGLLDSFSWDAGNIVLANLMLAITSEIQFGILQAKIINRSRKDGIGRLCNNKVRSLVENWSSRMLLLRVKNPKLAASHLLGEGRIMDTMSFCLRCERVSQKHGNNDRRKKHPSKCIEIDLANLDDSRIDAKSFVYAALSCCRHDVDLGDRSRIISCVKAFLSRRDPDPIENRTATLLNANLFIDTHRPVSRYDNDARIGSAIRPYPYLYRYHRRHSFSSETS